MDCRSIIFHSLRLRQLIDLLATDKSRYFAQRRSLIVNCVTQHPEAFTTFNLSLARGKTANFHVVGRVVCLVLITWVFPGSKSQANSSMASSTN